MNKRSPARLAFVDLLRGWAILVMMETHVFNTMLLPSIKATRWFGYLTFLNGLVAPTFLYVSGWVFVVASQRKLEDYRSFGPAFRKQLGRILLIWVLGYALHLPFYSYSKTRGWAKPSDWVKFCQMDILHCIAVGLLLLFLGRVFIADARRFERALFPLGVSIVGISPFLWHMDFMAWLPTPLAMYFQERSFSFFPLLPWLAFLVLGGAGAVAYQKSAALPNERRFIGWLGLVGIECVLAGFVFWEIPNRVPYAASSVGANPFFFLMRLGCILLLVFGCWHFTRKWPEGGKFSKAISRESLLVYVLHILVLYRVSRNNSNLATLYGNSLNLVEASSLLVALVITMGVTAVLWTWVKTRSQKVSRLLAYGAGIGAVALFFMN